MKQHTVEINRDRFNELVGKVRRIREEVGKVIVGQDDVIEKLLMCIFAGGHCLMMGVPGLAKTLIVRTLADVLDLGFKRIQFTPDLMPGDITGSEVIEERADGTKQFVFVRGPLFTNMILADEINRTPPKTQAALLEAMQEHRVTIGNATYPLTEPFFVLATQNPIEQEGTYPLPEAQQDRFMFFLWVDYPELDEESRIIAQTTGNRAVDLQHVMTGPEIIEIGRIVREIPVSQPLIDYAARIVRTTRTSRGKEGSACVPEFIRKYLQWGAGPRAGQYLVLGAKARAFINGHTHVAAEDVRAVAHPVLRHRIIVNFAAEAEGITSADLVEMILKDVKE
ncbi:MAG TPA: MoxR family ATPase [Planctomycetota bacterium]|nr:MoxR family ATPase [Planctomycetota bacterium]